MTKFDEAPSFDGDGWRWLRPIGRQPAVFIASIVAIAVVVSIAATFMLAAQAARFTAARLIGGTQLAVVLGPQVSRADAEAMRSKLESVPLVAGVRLQTREQALTQLASSSGLLVEGRSNPLPDIWVVTIRRPDSDGMMRSFADDRRRLEQTLVAMPGVASVRVDADWLAFVDRWVGTALHALSAVHATTLGVLAAIVFCIAFLLGRALRTGLEERGSAGPAILAGALAGLFGLAIAAALGAAVGNVVGSAPIEWAGLEPALRIGLASPFLAPIATVLAVSAIGTLLGGLR